MTYVLIVSRDGGVSWMLWDMRGYADREDALAELRRVQMEVPLARIAMKCIDSQLWKAVARALEASLVKGGSPA